MGYGIKYFDCCGHVDSELNGYYDEDNDQFIHTKLSNCCEKPLNKSEGEINNILNKYCRRYISSRTLSYPSKEILEDYISRNNLKERKNENIFKKLYLWDKFWESIMYVIENEGDEKKMKTKKWKYSLNVIDNLMY